MGIGRGTVVLVSYLSSTCHSQKAQSQGMMMSYLLVDYSAAFLERVECKIPW